MSANLKTNAMRILDKANIPYKTYSYSNEDGKIDGVSVAKKIGICPDNVFKTLVCQSNTREYFVFVLPVTMELNLKKAAKAVNQKSVEMIKVADINKVTGYIRGGCSPIGMKKPFKTVIDETCLIVDEMVVSAGKIGHQIQLTPQALIDLIGAKTADILA
jgi:Cys-tRNA(Pro)/Cys-tRNA(Cys) deacylase